MARPGYAPPALQAKSVLEKLREMFNTAPMVDKTTLVLTDAFSHETMRVEVENSPDILEQMVLEYIKWWRLMALYPEYRIVAPPPVFVVSNAHYALNREKFFYDLMRYLRVGEISNRRWRGPEDIDGLLDTTKCYEKTYGNPANPWRDMFRLTKDILDLENVETLRF